MKAKKKVVRAGRKSKRKLYFGPDTDQAIINFQNEECDDQKCIIYENKILPSFEKLIENLIFIHGFAKNHHNYIELKNDCVSFLYETLKKYDPSKGSKAFSYFNVVAKNWLIIQSKKKVKNLKRHVSLSNYKDMKLSDKNYIELHNSLPSQEDMMIFKENLIITREVFGKIRKKVNGNNEELCMNAIETLFDRVHELDFLNKRAIFVYMRDLSGLTPKQLSVAMSNIRKYYKEIKKHDNEYYSLFFL